MTRAFCIARLINRAWIETCGPLQTRTGLSCIARLINRAWIETLTVRGQAAKLYRIARLINRAWIETSCRARPLKMPMMYRPAC